MTPTRFVRVAEDGLLLVGPRAVSHPHRNGEGVLQAGAHHTIRNLDGLGAIKFKHLIAVVAVICWQPYGPVSRAAGSRKELHSAGAGS